MFHEATLDIGSLLAGGPQTGAPSLVLCINLDRRLDRWEGFQQAEILHVAQRLPATDGSQTGVPDWWTKGAGAWGCYRSHMNALERALGHEFADTNGVIVVLEDDAVPCNDFATRFTEFVGALPPDWQMVYLGGQARAGFTPVSEHVVRLNGAVRTHAYALRGNAIRVAYLHLVSAFRDSEESLHVDVLLEKMVQQGLVTAYGPKDWLIGQRASFSDVSRCTFPKRWWGEQERRPWVGPVWITGQHDGDSGSLAAALHSLGLNLGRNVRDSANPRRSYVAPVIARLLDDFRLSGSDALTDAPELAARRLRSWLARREREARFQRTVYGAHAPEFLRIIGILESLAPNGKYLVTSTDIRKRRTSIPAALQKEHRILPVQRPDLLEQPTATLSRIAEFIGLPVQPEDIDRATKKLSSRLMHL